MAATDQLEQLTRQQLEKLLSEKGGGLKATIYIPMHTSAAPPDMTENQIRFKNLLTQAAEKLRQQDAETTAKALAHLIDEYRDSLPFWEAQTPGLLICASQQETKLIQLPIDTQEYVAVDTQFHLAPLLGLVDDNQPFHLLLLAQQSPQLLRGDIYGFEPSQISLPVNIRSALNIDEPNQKSENQGTATAPSDSRGWFNGRGGARDPGSEDRLRFFRLIDKEICRALTKHEPLLLAGTEEDVADYRQISHYPALMEGSLAGNRLHDDQREVFQQAWQLVQAEIISPKHHHAVVDYERLKGTAPERVASDAETISRAAGEGRVDTLLARLQRHTHDTVRNQNASVLRITFPNDLSATKLNDIATRVWQTSGRVYNLTTNEMPEGALMAARLRY